ncbi:MAG: hypothetical protein JKY37_01175 [Nannocystaceae bacterium]|nr:hypothetical protein [Nannocystaceae bacterium]
MRTLVVAMAVACAGAPRLARAAPPADTKDVSPQLRRVFVGGRAVDVNALVPELRLRRPDLEFSKSPSARRDGSRLTIERRPGGLRLTLRASDGRTYVRDVPSDDDIGTRAVAADTTAFLGAVERGAIEPEPRGRKAKARRANDGSESPLGQRFKETLQLGAALGPSVTVPLAGPTESGAGAFVAGHLSFRVQTLHRVLVELSTRVGGTRAAGHRLIRGRLGFGAGYRFTRGAFDMPITAALTVEPWSIRQRTSNAPSLEAQGVPLARPASMVGLAVRVVPAVLVPLPGRLTLRVGGGVEFATSALPGGGSGAVRVETSDGDIAFRVAGFEATFLAEIAVWVPWRAIRRKQH